MCGMIRPSMIADSFALSVMLSSSSISDAPNKAPKPATRFCLNSVNCADNDSLAFALGFQKI